MSSFYSDASLVMIPSGYKTSKVYSAVPTDGAGDLVFSRTADTATRVGPDGLIEKVRTNHILQSNSFNTTWSVTTLTVTSGATDPNGGTTAWTAAATASSAVIQQSVTLTGLRTFSIYAKQGTLRYLYMGAYGGTISYATFDLQDGVVAAGTNARIESVGGGWYRCTCHSADGTTGGVQILPTDTISSGTIGTGNILIWRAQYETGDIATDYIATTSAAVSVGPVANVPRLDYLNSSCPRLLLEPQRTSSITFSEQTDNAAWTKRNSTISANSATSPDGYTNADKIQEDTTNDRHDIYQEFSVTSGTAYTISAFVKAAERTFCFLSFGSSTVNPNNAFFNLSTGAVVSSPAGVTSTITSYGNGWYRITSTATAGATGSAYIVNGPTLNASGVSYQGVSGSGILVYGYGAEIGAYATSYIPTLGAAVTRGADDCVKSSATSIIGQTEGVVFFEWEYQNVGSSGGNIPISLDGGSGKELYFWVQTNGVYLAEGFDGSVNQFSFTGAMGSFGTKKIAIAYKNNDFALYINGVLAGTDTSGTVPTLNRFYVGRFYANTSYNIASGIKQVLLFPTRLSNADLAALTA
jgi:hypothetical protein